MRKLPEYMQVNFSRFDGKLLLQIFTVINILAGIAVLPEAVLQTQRNFPTLVDFVIYYSAAHMVRESPDLLYNYPAYLHFYSTLNVILPSSFFGYVALPPLAIVFLPFAYLDCQGAYLAWSLCNLLGCVLLAITTAKLAGRMKLDRLLSLFLGSCVFSLWITGNVMLIGQLSILTCLLLTCLFMDLSSGESARGGFYLGVLMLIKYSLFIPLFLYMMGCRQWRVTGWAVFYLSLFMLISLLFFGPHVWAEYLHTLWVFSLNPWYLKVMPNLYSIAEYMLDGQHHGQLLFSIAAFYCMVSAAFFLRPWIAKQKPTLLFTAAAIIAGLFFSVYSLPHDTLLLLPVSVIITALLHARGKAYWMIPCYVLTSAITAQNLWCLRAAEIILGTIVCYLLLSKSDSKARSSLIS